MNKITVELYVIEGESCMKLLNYIKSNINVLKSSLYFNIKKITGKSEIKKFPYLKSSNGIYIGERDIVNFISRYNKTAIPKPIPDDVSNWQMRELYSGIKKDSKGNLLPNNEDEEESSIDEDLTRVDFRKLAESRGFGKHNKRPGQNNDIEDTGDTRDARDTGNMRNTRNNRNVENNIDDDNMDNDKLNDSYRGAENNFLKGLNETSDYDGIDENTRNGNDQDEAYDLLMQKLR